MGICTDAAKNKLFNHLKFNTMKTITILFSMLTLLAFNGYSQTTDVKGLLDNQETRTAIFNTIAGDHELMMGFMKVAKENRHATMMMENESSKMEKMKPNKGMVEMKDNHQMMDMMKDNPEMMMNMMGKMMDMCEKDSVMRNKMANMMTDHPEMMQMCMKKMKEKGMMGKDGEMEMMKPASSGMKKNHEHK